MINEKFLVGDIVYLKSGSPELTVVGFPDDNNAAVSWFYNGKLDCVKFPRVCLTKSTPIPKFTFINKN